MYDMNDKKTAGIGSESSEKLGSNRRGLGDFQTSIRDARALHSVDTSIQPDKGLSKRESDAGSKFRALRGIETLETNNTPINEHFEESFADGHEDLKGSSAFVETEKIDVTCEGDVVEEDNVLDMDTKSGSDIKIGYPNKSNKKLVIAVVSVVSVVVLSLLFLLTNALERRDRENYFSQQTTNQSSYNNETITNQNSNYNETSIEDNNNETLNNEFIEPYTDPINELVFFKCMVDVYGEYDGEPLNMRSGPGKNYGFVTTVPDDSVVDVLGFSENETDWLFVSYNGCEGWVLNKYIFPQNDYHVSDFEKYDFCRIEYETPDNAGLNLRASYSSNSDWLCTVAEGAVVQIEDEYNSNNNGYIKVSYINGIEHMSGWILADYLEKIGYVEIDYNDYDYVLGQTLYALPAGVVESDERISYEAVIVDADDSVILRNGPGTDYDKITSVAKNSLIYIVGKSYSTDEWFLVYYRYYDKHGWIYKDYLKPVKDADIVESNDGSVTVDNVMYRLAGACPIEAEVSADVGLVLRNAPNTEGRWILRMEYGDKLLDIAPCDDYPEWSYVEYDDGITIHKGFAYNEYIS